MRIANWVIAVSLTGLLLTGSLVAADGADALFDGVILHGRVMDPETNLDVVRNVGISNGKIREISAKELPGKETIEARGLIVAPGFIDLHEHGQEPRNYQFQARDGVTTSLELEAGTDDVDKWYAVREGKALINFGVSVGHIPVRMRVMHDPGMCPTLTPKLISAFPSRTALINFGVSVGHIPVRMRVMHDPGMC